MIEKDHIYNVSVYWNRDIRWHLDDSGADSGFRLDIRYHIEKIHFFPEASEAAAFFIEGGARGGVLVPSFKIIASGTPDYLISKKRRDAIGGLLEIMRPRRVRSQVVFELS
ncbi:MAG: hypothetical protein LBU23_01115 [Planctomycetota bacterium]|nr:hypothetical protein [Planctomycetota bacterium]